MTIDTRRNRFAVKLANLALRIAGSEYRETLTNAIRAGLVMRNSAAWAADLLMVAHRAADQLDDWHDSCSTNPSSPSPGGATRQAAHDAAGLTVDTCPACNCTCRPGCDEPACSVHGYFASAPVRDVESRWFPTDTGWYAEILIDADVDVPRLVAHARHTDRSQLVADLRALSAAAAKLAGEIEPTHRPAAHLDLPGWDG